MPKSVYILVAGDSPHGMHARRLFHEKQRARDAMFEEFHELALCFGGGKPGPIRWIDDWATDGHFKDPKNDTRVKSMSVESAWEDAAYTAAVMVYLIETKADEADEEICQLLANGSWRMHIVMAVLRAYSKSNEQAPSHS